MILLRSSFLQPLQSGGIDGLRDALQKAIQLEHATIPPYLYALYSLGTDPKNATVAGIIQSVVSEEMLHMTLACNLLNAVGGEPLIDDPTFIPSYPGPLPGGVDGGLTVHLAPFTLEVIENTFMAIEEPERHVDFPVRLAAMPGEDDTSKTIGAFYRLIAAQITALGPSVFTGDAARQVKPPFPPSELGDEGFNGLVTDEKSALAAIDLIIDQGEGNDPGSSPLEDGPGSGLSHYYRFSEIVKGRRLVADTSVPQGWSYSGPPLVAAGPIAAVETDPKAAALPVGSAASRQR